LRGICAVNERKFKKAEEEEEDILFFCFITTTTVCVFLCVFVCDVLNVVVVGILKKSVKYNK